MCQLCFVCFLGFLFPSFAVFFVLISPLYNNNNTNWQTNTTHRLGLRAPFLCPMAITFFATLYYPTCHGLERKWKGKTTSLHRKLESFVNVSFNFNDNNNNNNISVIHSLAKANDSPTLHPYGMRMFPLNCAVFMESSIFGPWIQLSLLLWVTHKWVGIWRRKFRSKGLNLISGKD